jgi:hypothetical protein
MRLLCVLPGKDPNWRGFFFARCSNGIEHQNLEDIILVGMDITAVLSFYVVYKTCKTIFTGLHTSTSK